MLEVGKYYSHDWMLAQGFDLVADNFNETIAVYKLNHEYYVLRNNICRHPQIDAEGVIRALSMYIR